MKRQGHSLTSIKTLLTLLILAAAVVGIMYLVHTFKNADISLGSDPTIDITPEKIAEIKRIGQWEFLSVVDEEVVDTVRVHTLLPDDRLTCIYYGTVRMGIDLTYAGDDWVELRGDTVVVTLPTPRILDTKFIDEARTRVFYERGRWSPSAREQMYRRARSRMASKAMTADNVQAVRQQAERRFEQLMLGLGAMEVVVRFDDEGAPGFNRY